MLFVQSLQFFRPPHYQSEKQKSIVLVVVLLFCVLWLFGGAVMMTLTRWLFSVGAVSVGCFETQTARIQAFTKVRVSESTRVGQSWFGGTVVIAVKTKTS